MQIFLIMLMRPIDGRLNFFILRVILYGKGLEILADFEHALELLEYLPVFTAVFAASDFLQVFYGVLAAEEIFGHLRAAD